MSGAQTDWANIRDDLARREPSLTAPELDLLGECLFWLDRRDERITVLGRAFSAHVADGDDDAGAMAAWHLFYEHALVGEVAPANGWLERARRRSRRGVGPGVAGFLAVAESDAAADAGALDDAIAHAERAVQLGAESGDADLLAMGLQARGRRLVAAGRLDEGISSLDEAMAAVVNGEVAPMFTGWVFCNALSTCHDVADVRRAVEWSDAATRWCESLRDGRLYRGICRLHVVELASLQGSWQTAAGEAELARDELTRHDPRYAGEAHYLVGELHRLTGDLDLAEEAFTRAHELGRVPQPGLARVRLSQGRADAAVRALELALEPRPAAPLRRAELLAALVEAHVAADDLAGASAAAAELAEVASASASDYLAAVALDADATVLLAGGDVAGACGRADDAAGRFRRLGMPYCEARARVVRGVAARAIDDPDTAHLELTTAHDTFRRLGAEPDARRVAALLTGSPPSPLSSREVEVLRLVARGGTNKTVAAELTVSEHTVARHLSNIYTKLGVRSRSAATAYAYEHALL